MRTLRNIIIVVVFLLWTPLIAQGLLPYIVFNASKGVILKSPARNEEFYPVSGTRLFERDFFLINDDRYFVKIKDIKSGEIFTWNKGKGLITPLQIVSKQRFDLYDKFSSFLNSLARETGFDTEPVRTSQGVIVRGKTKGIHDSLSISVASQIRNAISDNNYVEEVDFSKAYSQDKETFCYSVHNRDTINYAMILYTVTKDSIYKHDDIIVHELGRERPDKIEFLRLIPSVRLNLDYFYMAAKDGEDDRTCYALLFNPSDFYVKNDKGNYDNLIDWEIITKELKYQGDICRVIYIRK